MTTADGKLLVPHLSIEEECKRNSELKILDLHILMDWMNKQAHLPKVDLFLLISFLHTNYYRIEPTKTMIESYFTLRTHTPEFFSNRDLIACKELQETSNTMMMTVLEKETNEAYMLIVGVLMDPNPIKYDLSEIYKYLIMTTELHCMLRSTTKPIIMIFDVSQFSFGHLARTQIMIIRKLLYFIQECMPARLMGLHMLNATSAMEKLLNIIKPFIKSELSKILHVHSSLETAKRFLPVEILPNEAGGKGGPMKELSDQNIKLLIKYREWFEYDEYHQRVNESLRIGKCQTMEALFGMDGTFRRLEID